MENVKKMKEIIKDGYLTLYRHTEKDYIEVIFKNKMNLYENEITINFKKSLNKPWSKLSDEDKEHFSHLRSYKCSCTYFINKKDAENLRENCIIVNINIYLQKI